MDSDILAAIPSEYIAHAAQGLPDRARLPDERRQAVIELPDGRRGCITFARFNHKNRMRERFALAEVSTFHGVFPGAVQFPAQHIALQGYTGK